MNQYELRLHPHSDIFTEAQLIHLRSHREVGSWREIRLKEVGSNQLLDCMWVMIYKFDKQKYLIKAKARLVVRGDQQASHVGVDNYAPTLEGRSFWL
jgi:hypothetical protein